LPYQGSALPTELSERCPAIESKRLRRALQRRRPMERETGIEPAPSAWKAEVLPLNYSRPEQSACCVTRHACNRRLHRVHCGGRLRTWWREVDSNHRRRKPADLQSAPVGRLGIPPAKSRLFSAGTRPKSTAC